VHHGRSVHANVVVVVEVEEFLPRELGVVVSDDLVGYAEEIDDVSEEYYGFLGAYVHNGSHLDPLGELVGRYEDMCEALGHLSDGPTMLRCHTAKGHVMGMV
jgi:hypothetical protein